MTKVVELKVKRKEGEDTVITTKKYEVEEIHVFQFKALMGVVLDVMKMVNDDDSLKGLFSKLYRQSDEELAKLSPEEQLEADADIITKALASFETLAVHLPEQAFKILSIMSDIPEEEIDRQPLKVVFEIYDAIVDVNDIEELVERIKKSSMLTQAKFKFKEFIQKAKGAISQ